MCKFVSSASSVVSKLEALGRSLTYSAINSGPNTEPCGTQCSILHNLDMLYHTFVQILRTVRYDCNRLNAGPQNL